MTWDSYDIHLHELGEREKIKIQRINIQSFQKGGKLNFLPLIIKNKKRKKNGKMKVISSRNGTNN